jgi:hypothetical protein
MEGATVRTNGTIARAPDGGGVTIVRSALEMAGLVISLLLIAVGGGLTSDPVVVITTALGLSLSLMLIAMVARWRKPRQSPAR